MCSYQNQKVKSIEFCCLIYRPYSKISYLNNILYRPKKKKCFLWPRIPSRITRCFQLLCLFLERLLILSLSLTTVAVLKSMGQLFWRTSSVWVCRIWPRVGCRRGTPGRKYHTKCCLVLLSASQQQACDVGLPSRWGCYLGWLSEDGISGREFSFSCLLLSIIAYCILSLLLSYLPHKPVSPHCWSPWSSCPLPSLCLCPPSSSAPSQLALSFLPSGGI